MATAPATARHAPGHTQAPGHADRLARLNTIEGQIRGISRMVTDARSCIDVPTQISAAGRAPQEGALGLLDEQVRGCVTAAARTGPARAEQRYAELTDPPRRALRL